MRRVLVAALLALTSRLAALPPDYDLDRLNDAPRIAANPAAVCRYMKMTTPAALLRCLREGVTEVTVDPDVAGRARRAVQAMLAARAS